MAFFFLYAACTRTVLYQWEIDDVLKYRTNGRCSYVRDIDAG